MHNYHHIIVLALNEAISYTISYDINLENRIKCADNKNFRNGGHLMKGKMSTNMGSIVIDRDVLAKYAGTAAMECIGIVGMASVNVKDGVARLLKKENAGRGVNLYVVNNKLKIELHIIVAYGVSIRAVAQNVLENVRYKIEEFTGLEIETINVIVEGVRIMDED